MQQPFLRFSWGHKLSSHGTYGHFAAILGMTHSNTIIYFNHIRREAVEMHGIFNLKYYCNIYDNVLNASGLTA